LTFNGSSLQFTSIYQGQGGKKVTGAERKRERQKAQQAQTPNHAQQAVAEVVKNLRDPNARPFLLDMQRDILKALRSELRLKHTLAHDVEARKLTKAVKEICTHLILRGGEFSLDAVKAILAGGKIPA